MTKFLDSDGIYEAVRDIFAVTVLLDKRERDREMIEYTHATMLHNHKLRPNKILSRHKILDEFEARKDYLAKAIASDHEDSYKVALLGRIKDEKLQRSVLSSIFTISVCDYELHDEESDFIRKALSIWKTDMPTSSELDAVG
ncbi:hypothetical protein ACJ3XI_03075 [Litorimonas sp. RW-G-Af-16]|uniref:hypothetical protein n=1 Tax=Litorimonas sp. RW-G-Af-16 TaxID=3241168 RepID=UPI00390C42EC